MVFIPYMYKINLKPVIIWLDVSEGVLDARDRERDKYDTVDAIRRRHKTFADKTGPVLLSLCDQFSHLRIKVNKRNTTIGSIHKKIIEFTKTLNSEKMHV